MSDEHDSVAEPEKTVRERRAPAHPRPPEEGGDEAAAEGHTSPFPYAENFEEWVADETAGSDGR